MTKARDLRRAMQRRCRHECIRFYSMKAQDWVYFHVQEQVSAMQPKKKTRVRPATLTEQDLFNRAEGHAMPEVRVHTLVRLPAWRSAVSAGENRNGIFLRCRRQASLLKDLNAFVRLLASESLQLTVQQQEEELYSWMEDIFTSN